MRKIRNTFGRWMAEKHEFSHLTKTRLLIVLNDSADPACHFTCSPFTRCRARDGAVFALKFLLFRWDALCRQRCFCDQIKLNLNLLIEQMDSTMNARVKDGFVRDIIWTHRIYMKISVLPNILYSILTFLAAVRESLYHKSRCCDGENCFDMIPCCTSSVWAEF